MIPVQGVIPTRSVPVATLTLIAINALAFLLQWWTAVPITLDFTGGIRALFFHAGAMSFGVNVLFLWLFGDNVEDQTGRARFVTLYFVSGISATLAQAFIDPGVTRTLIGTSGAVSGVLGAYFVLYPRSRILVFFPLPLTLHELPAAFFLGVWFLLQFVTLAAQAGSATHPAGIPPGLAAHAVGLATGALLCLALRRRERGRVEWWGK